MIQIKSVALAMILSLLCNAGRAQKVLTKKEVWDSRSEQEKIAYLEGVCEGLRNLPGEKIADVTCMPVERTTQQKITFRFCGLPGIWDGMRYVDVFYSDIKNYDVPVYLAINEYNDKACGENNSANGIQKAREYGQCVREWISLAGVENQTAVLKAKWAVCDRFR